MLQAKRGMCGYTKCGVGWAGIPSVMSVSTSNCSAVSHLTGSPNRTIASILGKYCSNVHG